MRVIPSQAYIPGPNQAGAEAISVARTALGCTVEFVVLEEHRTLVAAGGGEDTLTARSPHPSEREVYNGMPIGVGPNGTAVAVNLSHSDPPAALFAAATLDTSGIAILSGLANMLANNLNSTDSEARRGFDEELDRVARLEREQRDLVRSTLDNNKLVMHFQPIVDLNSRPVAIEALARVQAEDGTIVTPAGFIDAIEGTRLMVSLDRRAFELSCRAAVALKSSVPGNRLYVSCNFSATSLAEADLADTVLGAITNHRLSPEQLCVEVTETALFEAGPEQLTRLRQAGVRIALDNFGTGYAELSTLRDLPLTGVKIDKSFTAALDKSGTERAIAATVLELAKSLGLSVVAEGVENARQWRAARSLGLEKMQGWFYSPAIPYRELLELLTGVTTPTPDVVAH